MKIIKVNGCHDCPVAKIRYSGTDLDQCFTCGNSATTIDEHMESRTVHPNCPLEDIDAGKIAEAINAKATENIRKIYEKYKDFKTLPPMDFWSAIKADLKIE